MRITPPGTLYLIGERNHVGTLTDLYKIGVVRSSDKRSTADRLAEHQTGNPRELVLVFTDEAPLIERVETVLHGEHATCRIGGEWFVLPGDKIDHAISRAQLRLSEARAIAPVIARAAELSTLTSDGTTRAATTNEIELHRELTSVKKHLDLCKSTSNELVQALLAAQQTKPAASKWIREESKTGTIKFDQKAFAAAHPRIFQRYLITKTTTSRRFRLQGIDPEQVAITNDLTELVNDASALLSASADPEALHTHYLQLHEVQARWQWLDEQVEARMREACSQHESIDGLCTWSRRTETKEFLDTDSLKEDKPQLYERFLTRSPDSIAVIPTKDLAYRSRPRLST